MQTIKGTAEEAQVREIVREEIARFYAESETVLGEVVEADGPRDIVRQEIASLAGLAMRRLQDENFTRSFERNTATDAAKEVIGHFWAEVLAEYGGEK